MEKFGVVVLKDGTEIGGYSLDDVLEIAEEMHECEMPLLDVVGDIAVEANLLRDLANRIKELEQG